MQHSQHEHHHEVESNRREAVTPKDVGALACGASCPFYREKSQILDSTQNTNEGREMSQDTAYDYVTPEYIDTVDKATANEDRYAGIPKIPHDLFASEPMPQLRSSYSIDGEVRACVKIPSDIYSDLHRLNSRGGTDADTLGAQIEACNKLIRYLDRYREMVSFSNIRFISDELEEKFEHRKLGIEDLKRARRAITGLQVEVSREIDRLKDLRHKAIWGNSYSYRVDSSTS